MAYVSAVIVAGGKGTRMGSKVKKQYLKLNQKEILVHTIEAFEKNPEINEIIIVTSKEDIDYVQQMICGKYGFKKITQIVAGGKERQDSVNNGIEAVHPNAEYIMIHDGARPLIQQHTITQALYDTYRYKATIVAVQVKDTIKVANADQEVESTPRRDTLWSVQTPQTFEANLIKRAYSHARSNNISATDDSMLVEALGEKVKIVEGDYSNIKITTTEDLIIATSILDKRDRGSH